MGSSSETKGSDRFRVDPRVVSLSGATAHLLAVRVDVHKFTSSERHFSAHFQSSPEVQSAAKPAEAGEFPRLRKPARILTQQPQANRFRFDLTS
jgi:hypothetical protein